MILFIFSVLIASCSQILLKKGSSCSKIYMNPYSIFGYSMMILSTFLTVLAYKQIELSTGVLLESLSYVFVPFLSYFFLNENLNRHRIIGMIIIILGIIFFHF